MKSNHQKKKVVLKPDRSIEGTSIEGFMPDPETLRELEELHKGCTAKWMELSEKEIVNRQRNERWLVTGYTISSILGQVFAFIVSMAVIGAGVYAIYLGHPEAGAGIIVGGAAAVIGAFLLRKKSDKA